ncbi:MAG: transcriptional regulator NrdR [Patescibacteria group bacterium]|jgi:transcriptional repressor NrdR
MKCPFCSQTENEVVETRLAEEGNSLRRRRECTGCKKRFTTYERVDRLPIVVIKRNGIREVYDRNKLKGGIIKSCEKTVIGNKQIEEILDQVESELRKLETTEIESKIVGDLVAKKLKKLDKIAYIRFSSVFKRFVDVEDFERELKKLL